MVHDSVDGAENGYAWLRDGSPIDGAVASSYQASYVVAVADLERDLSLRLTATRTAHVPGSSTTAGLPVARPATSTTAKAAKKVRASRLERGKHVLRVRYLGSATAEASKAREVVVRGRR